MRARHLGPGILWLIVMYPAWVRQPFSLYCPLFMSQYIVMCPPVLLTAHGYIFPDFDPGVMGDHTVGSKPL